MTNNKSPKWQLFGNVVILISLIILFVSILYIFTFQANLSGFGVTEIYPIEVTIDFPETIDLSAIPPDMLNKYVPDAINVSHSLISRSPETIDRNLILEEMYLDNERVSFSYGFGSLRAILSPNDENAGTSCVKLSLLTPGTHSITRIAFQKYDPNLKSPPQPAIATKIFTVVDSGKSKKCN